MTTTYQVSGYRYGSTNGQSPLGFVFVTGAADKKEALEIGRQTLKCYKTIGFKIPAKTTVEHMVQQCERLYKGKPVHVVSV